MQEWERRIDRQSSIFAGVAVAGIGLALTIFAADFNAAGIVLVGYGLGYTHHAARPLPTPPEPSQETR